MDEPKYRGFFRYRNRGRSRMLIMGKALSSIFLRMRLPIFAIRCRPPSCSGTGKTTARGRPFFCWIAACDTAPGEDEETVDVCVRFCGKPGGFAGFPLVISSFIRYNERIPGEGCG